MKAVILAGGIGSRLAEETTVRPKPMVEVGGKPIIWHIMRIYAHHGVSEFIVCAGYKSEILKEYFVNLRLHHSDITVDTACGTVTYHKASDLAWKVTIVDTGGETMTGGRLKRIRAHLDPGEPFCLTYGDGVGDVDIATEIAFHRDHGLMATMTVVAPASRFGAARVENGRIVNFVEKPLGEHGAVNGGFFVLDPSVVDLIEGERTVWEREPLERLAAMGQLAAFRHDGFWQPMDTLRDVRTLEELWERGNAPWKVWS